MHRLLPAHARPYAQAGAQGVHAPQHSLRDVQGDLAAQSRSIQSGGHVVLWAADACKW